MVRPNRAGCTVAHGARARFRGTGYAPGVHAAAALALLLLLVPAPAEARRGRSRARAEPTRARILLAGAWAEIRWTDGDTFKVLTGPHAGRTARLGG
jgi:hypothetical protein